MLVRLPRTPAQGVQESCPYRKPTQVVEESILRRSSESRPRNSAKWPCNFGRRGASSNLLEKPQRKGPGDCLTQTHGYAKSQDEVYGLTPARCWKVKRGG